MLPKNLHQAPVDVFFSLFYVQSQKEGGCLNFESLPIKFQIFQRDLQILNRLVFVCFIFRSFDFSFSRYKIVKREKVSDGVKGLFVLVGSASLAEVSCTSMWVGII